MKSTIGTLILFSTFVFQTNLLAQRQLEPGVWSVNGIAAYSKISAVSAAGFTTDQTRYTLHPGLSYFLLQGLEAVVSIDFESIRSVYGPPSFYTSSPPTQYNYGFLLGVRKYFSVAEEYSPFVGGSAGPSWWRIVQSGIPTFSSKPEWKSQIEAGVDLFFGNSFAFEPSINYSRNTLYGVKSSTTEIGFGIRYFFVQ